jgi:putative transposase
MTDRARDLPVTKQAQFLRISHGRVYYRPRPGGPCGAGSTGCIGGSRMPSSSKTLMRRMGIEALYRRPRTSKPESDHKVYPYLLHGMAIEPPNQVWAMDITYNPMARGFVYLAVVLDWFSHRVLAWRSSITMEATLLRRCADRGLGSLR